MQIKVSFTVAGAADLNVKTLVQERKNSEAKNLADYKKEFIYIITHLLSNDIEFLCYFEKIDPVTINALLNHQLKPSWFFFLNLFLSFIRFQAEMYATELTFIITNLNILVRVRLEH